MTTPYIVQCKGLTIFPQRASSTHDGFSDENADSNCWAACVCSLLKCYGIRRGYPLYDYYEPDDVKDWAWGQNAVKQIGYNTTIMNCLAHFGGIPSMTIVPQGKQNYVNGLLDIEYQYLKRGIPVIESADWIDDAGAVHKDVNHWTVIESQTQDQVVSLDSWPLPSGGRRYEDYAMHYARSNQVLVVPTSAPL